MIRIDRLAVDCIYLLYFSALSLFVLAKHAVVEDWMLLLGIHAVIVVGIIALGFQPKRVLHDWYPVLLFWFSFQEVAYLARSAGSGWRDPALLVLECTLFRTLPNVWFTEIANPLLTEILQAGYFSYLPMLPLVGLALYRRDRVGFKALMRAAVATYVACYVIYIAWPTLGPQHTLPGMDPAALPGYLFHTLVLNMQRFGGVYGNAFPSAHVANAVVCTIVSWRYLRKHAPVVTVLTVLMAVGAVYNRYHYAIDVLAGAALGALVATIVLRSSRVHSTVDYT